MATIEDCKIIYLPKILRPQGNLTPVEPSKNIPFEIARVYFLYDVPGGSLRGGHAHRELQQLIVAAMGSFEVVIDDGWRKKRIMLNRAYYGLYLPPMTWREIENFSSGGICLVMASAYYDEKDYIRDYGEFSRERQFNDGSIS